MNANKLCTDHLLEKCWNIFRRLAIKWFLNISKRPNSECLTPMWSLSFYMLPDKHQELKNSRYPQINNRLNCRYNEQVEMGCTHSQKAYWVYSNTGKTSSCVVRQSTLSILKVLMESHRLLSLPLTTEAYEKLHVVS